MDLHEFIRMTTIINRLAKRALFAEKQMVALEGQCAEWQRIADELKAERNALRSTTIDTAAGHLLDAFGSLANEPRNGAPDAEYRDRIVMKIHAIKLERDALRTECDDLRRVFSLVHGSLGIQQGEHIGNAIEALKKERDELMIQVQDMRAEIDALNTRIRQSRGEYDAIKKERDELNTRLRQSIARGDFAEMRATELTAEIERLKKPARQHPVAVGEWVQDGHGKKRQVREVHVDWYVLSTGYSWTFDFCTPCDPPEATHDTPEGRASAESVIRDDRKTAPDEIKVGDVVRATFWKAGQAAVVKEILADGRLMLDCSDQPWRVDEVVKLMRKVTP